MGRRSRVESGGVLLSVVGSLVLLASHGVAEEQRGGDRQCPSIEVLEGGAPSVVRSRSASPDKGTGAGQSGDALVNGEFDEDLSGWTVSESGGAEAPGTVTAPDGRAVLREGDSFLVTLEHSFTLPPFASTIRFDVGLEPGFDSSETFIPDTFELSLLDADLLPVIGSWDPLATSSFNLAEDGTVRMSERVGVEGTRVTLDVAGLPAGLEVTLYFDFIGADADTSGELWVDGVALATAPPGGIFIRGESNSDRQVDISDPVFTLNYLFLGGARPRCLDALDSNNSGDINITDPIYTLNFLFLGGPRTPAPYPLCGEDVGPEDGLGCEDGPCGG